MRRVLHVVVHSRATAKNSSFTLFLCLPSRYSIFSLLPISLSLLLEFHTRTYNKILSLFPPRRFSLSLSLSARISLLSIALQRILCQRAR